MMRGDGLAASAADLALLVAALLGTGGLGTWAKVIYDRRRGISSDERVARRDTLADRDTLIEQLIARIETLERWRREEEARRERLLRTISAQSQHITLLEAFSWQVYRGEAQPPPPARPDALTLGGDQ